MDLETTLQRLGIALGLGLLVGLQRELTASELAGIRTFPLISVFGAFAALLSLKFGGWVLALCAVSLAIVLLVGNLQLRESRGTKEGPGITTEVAALVTFGVGAYLMVGHVVAAVAVGGLTAVLLQLKEPLHKFVSRIGDKDAHVIAQFVLIALVILPILPNKAYGPYQVINPFEIWTVVVLIVGIGLAAYICQLLFGAKAGTLLGGILGGLISSTATTVSYARRSKQTPATSLPAAIVILIASTIVFVRIIVEICFVAPSKAAQLVPPIAVMFVIMAAISGAVYLLLAQRTADGADTPNNPADLKGALMFGLVYSIIILAVAAGKDFFGDRGLYVISVISGLTDVDALTLSTSQLANQERLDPATAAQLILIGAVSNLLFKLGMVSALGDRQLAKFIAISFGIAVAAGVALIFAWKSLAPTLASMH